MAYEVTEEALARPQQTLKAARVLYDKAETIAAVCESAQWYEVIVAVVEENHVFGGSWSIPRPHLYEQVEPLEANGWVLLFRPRTTAKQIRGRCLTMARLASMRLNVLQRIASRADDHQS